MASELSTAARCVAFNSKQPHSSEPTGTASTSDGANLPSSNLFLDVDQLHFAQCVNDLLSPGILYRFAFVHLYAIRQRGYSLEEISPVYQSASICITRYGIFNVTREKLGEYDELVKLHKFVPSFGYPRPPQPRTTLRAWLLDGPDFHDNFHQPLWQEYFSAVRTILRNPQSKTWLDQHIGLILDTAGQAGHAPPPCLDAENDHRQNPMSQNDPESNDEEGLLGSNNLRLSPRPNEKTYLRVLHALSRICIWLLETLFHPVCALICIVNLSSGIAYVAIMNNLGYEEDERYSVGTIVVWCLTAALMTLHGVYNGGGIYAYLKRLFILGLFTCFVVVIVSHIVGATNFSSSFPLGISIAILLILFKVDVDMMALVRMVVEMVGSGVNFHLR